MDIDQIIESVNKLTEKEKNKWSFKSVRLFKQFESSLFLAEPYRLVLDSNWIFRRLRTPIPEITGHFSRKNFLSKIKNYSSLFFKNFRTDLVPSKWMR